MSSAPKSGERCGGVLRRLIVVCNKRYHKKTTLQELDAEIDLLRSHEDGEKHGLP